MLSAESSTRALTPSGRISYARIDKKVDGETKQAALAALALTGVALLASYVPIRRMLAQNPLASLRND